MTSSNEDGTVAAATAPPKHDVSPFLRPEWPAPANVGALLTTRRGGVGQGVYASCNLGAHVGDAPADVAANRRLVAAQIGCRPVWLNQVHGVGVIDAAGVRSGEDPPPDADASLSREPHIACAVLTADCLPVLFCDTDGSVVAAAHAGWRGLLAGVLEATIEAMGAPADRLLAYLGPAIGPAAFEVGGEVRDAFCASSVDAAAAFVPGVAGKWQADIYALARQRLQRHGVERIFGGGWCTVSDEQRFFSYRRDGTTGRMASLIWLKSA